jgi:hypothetical protein
MYICMCVCVCVCVCVYCIYKIHILINTHAHTHTHTHTHTVPDKRRKSRALTKPPNCTGSSPKSHSVCQASATLRECVCVCVCVCACAFQRQRQHAAGRAYASTPRPYVSNAYTHTIHNLPCTIQHTYRDTWARCGRAKSICIKK